jgi:hypothetical protein
MADELKEESIPENAREWKASFTVNTGIKSYLSIDLSQLKRAVKSAREKKDETPAMPIEPWVIRIAFERAGEMISRINDKGVKLMEIDVAPKEVKTGV